MELLNRTALRIPDAYGAMLAIPLFILHGLEEGGAGILALDPFFRRCGGAAPYVLAAEIAAISATLFLAATARPGTRWRAPLRVLAAGLCLAEGQHIGAAVALRGYYPGLFTAVVIVAAAPLFLVRQGRVRR